MSCPAAYFHGFSVALYEVNVRRSLYSENPGGIHRNFKNNRSEKTLRSLTLEPIGDPFRNYAIEFTPLGKSCQILLLESWKLAHYMSLLQNSHIKRESSFRASGARPGIQDFK
jgi:hypothetical protein